MGTKTMTLGELRTATAGMEDDLYLDFALVVLGRTVHCGVKSAKRVDDANLGFGEAAFELCVDPNLIASDESLMTKLEERRGC